MHDFEAERVRIMNRDSDDDHKKNVVFDERVPLSIRAQPLTVADSWIRKWNKAHPDQKPIPRFTYRVREEDAPKLRM